MNARTATLAPAAKAQLPGSLLQRKCACGNGASVLNGDCEDCQRARTLGLQPRLEVDTSDDPLHARGAASQRGVEHNHASDPLVQPVRAIRRDPASRGYRSNHHTSDQLSGV